MPNYSFQSVGMRRKQNFEFSGFKASLSPQLLPYAFCPPRVYRFSFPVFVGHLPGFLSLGKGFAKSLRIVKLF